MRFRRRGKPGRRRGRKFNTRRKIRRHYIVGDRY